VAKKKSKQRVSTYAPPEERVEAGLVEADYELQPRDEADADGQLHDLDALDEQAALAERFGAAHASAITTHPLRMDALPEDHPAAISEDYGEGYDHTLKGAATVQSQPNVAASDLDRHSVGDFTQEQLAERNADVDATDSARDLAAEEGVDLNDVEGTGEGGRVTKADVESYLSEQD
jgi:pyruvate/2-oxoglutarate dehydrogenase complex dihydrolipoamide acyltransferase (E2) component